MADQKEGWMVVNDGIARFKFVRRDGTLLDFICGNGSTIKMQPGWLKPNPPFQSPVPSGS